MRAKAVGLILFISVAFRVMGQDPNIKVVVDRASRKPLDYAVIMPDTGGCILKTNAAGKVIVMPDPHVRSFSVYKMGYQVTRLGAKTMAEMDTIFLQPMERMLGEVTVNAQKVGKIISDKRFYVDDYLILPNNDFLVLFSGSAHDQFNVAYYKPQRGIVFQKPVRESGGDLVIDCFSNIQLVTATSSRQLLFTSDSSFMFLSPYSRERYDSTLANCAAVIDSTVVRKITPKAITVQQSVFNYTTSPPFVTYALTGRNFTRDFYTCFHNKRVREMVASEAGDQVRINQARIDLGLGKLSPELTESTVALVHEQIGKPIYAPVFFKHDTIILFDMQERIVVRFNRKGEEIGRVLLEDEFSTYHNYEIICDPSEQDFYFRTQFKDASYLYKIGTTDGRVKKKIHLAKTFASNVQVAGGVVYFLASDAQWDDTRYLYIQRPD